jgi:hypothetical protein
MGPRSLQVSPWLPEIERDAARTANELRTLFDDGPYSARRGPSGAIAKLRRAIKILDDFEDRHERQPNRGPFVALDGTE